MIGALKLDPNMYALVDEKNKDAISGEYILKLTETVPVSQIEKNITTYSPRLLLVEPNLKKKVWDDMQSLLQSMKE